LTSRGMLRFFGAVVLVGATWATPALAQSGGDTRVSAGSPASPFSANKQNEPAVAIDANHPGTLAAGANDEIDMEACNAGTDNTCPFTPGVGVSGVYFSFDSAGSWSQPTYSGLSARNCTGAPGDSDPPCQPQQGPIGTLPNYYENGLVSDGDPALAFGPAPKNGRFAWANGSRLYYANLTSNRPDRATFKGAEAIAVSHTDNVQSAASGANNAWSAPVIASKQSGAKFSDKEQIWADNAATSKFFGNVYVCYAAFRGNGNGATNQPLDVITSRDGGQTWTDRQVTSATNNTHSRNGFGRSGCTVRTDSQGVVYVFDYQFASNPNGAAAGKIQMIKSTDGGAHWSRPVNLFTAYDTCSEFEPSIGRCVEDGVAGARSDLSPDPSVDIANGAPGGSDATDRLVMSWVDGRTLNHEHVMFSTSTDGGKTWSTPRSVEQPGDRGYYTAPAISPNGQDVYVVYNAFETPFRFSATGPGNDRELVGVVLHADASSSGVGAFSEVHRGTPGDARGSSQNDLAAEFLGDYVYAAATRTYGAAVWNDMRNGADCPAIDRYRQALHDEAVSSGQQTAEAEEPRGEDDGQADASDSPTPPAVQQECPANFGNSDIYGGGYSDPTP
jgi:Neuraminidase (sialidase)